MLNKIINTLDRFGELIQFGSSVDPNISNPNDIDIALFVSGHVNQEILKINRELEKKRLCRFCLVERLITYDSLSPTRQPDQVFHILVCDLDDALTNHPIFKSVNCGIPLSLKRVA